ncbi:MAG: alpha/beta fold hydrolase [Saprospiraceae bacterium]|nr:alpha/beta fold hydrolase [Saprospiraceae bacterium]
MSHNIRYFKAGDFVTENGSKLEKLKIAYHTFGSWKGNDTKVIWVCHALTASSDVSEWWSNLFGAGKILDPKKYYIVCANNLGSCYGTCYQFQENENELSNQEKLSIRDQVQCHRLLQKKLGIHKIYLLIGGSQGAQQAMEWAIIDPMAIQNLVLIATNARHSAWGIAFNEAQRMALESGEMGIHTARAIAMLSYRNYQMYEKTRDYKGSEAIQNILQYQRYQGSKLANRFTRKAYYILSIAMDLHDVGRGRNSMEEALKRIQAKTLIIGISSDQLFPVVEQKYLSKHIAHSKLHIIRSEYGHDGFLTEGNKVNRLVLKFLAS